MIYILDKLFKSWIVLYENPKYGKLLDIIYPIIVKVIFKYDIDILFILVSLFLTVGDDALLL